MWSQIVQRFWNRKSLVTPAERIRHAAFVAMEPMEPRRLMSFSLPVPYPATIAPVAMTTADFNHDGNADVVTTNAANGLTPAAVTVLLNNAYGTFSSAVVSPLVLPPGSSNTGSQAGTLATGDINGDGNADLAVISTTGSGMVLLGNGDGTFTAPIVVSIGNSPSRITIADINHDGRGDLLTANTSGNVAVTLSNSDGTYTTAQYPAGPSAQDVVAIDLNHDGNVDLAVADALSAGTVSVLMGRGDGTFAPYTPYYAFSAPYRMTTGDYNGDGNPDICVANSYTSSFVTILYGSGDGTFGSYHSYDTGSQPWEIQTGDVDGDGKPDLIDSNGSSYQIELNNGDGTFAAPTSVAGAGLVFAAGDFNHDGTIDIAGANGVNVGVMINNAASQANISTAVALQVTASSNAIAGAPLNLTVAAVDANGAVVNDFLGTVHVTSTDPHVGAFTYTFTAIDGGAHTFANTALYTAGPQTISAAGPAQLTGSQSVTVVAANPSTFNIVADNASVAGTATRFTITAKDAFGNYAANYVGAVHFTSTDTAAVEL